MEALRPHAATAALAADIDRRLAALAPAAGFDAAGLTRLADPAAPLGRLGGWCDARLDGRGALTIRDATGVAGFSWTDSARPLGLLRYQTLNDGSYAAFRAEYLAVRRGRAATRRS